MDVSRRRFLGASGLVLGAAAGGAAVGASASEDGSGSHITEARVDFHGAHQAGIVTPAQDRLHFAAFDLTTTSRDDLVQLLEDWTAAARKMTGGLEVGTGARPGDPTSPPDDTGEALGLPAARLTITVGFGPSLFDDRFGLKAQRPAALVDLPAFLGDDLDPDRSGGDLCIQACADDPQVAVHAVRNMARIAHGTASVRWSQLGFGRTSSTSSSQATPRNMLGFKDGTRNITAEDTADLHDHVWVQSGDGPSWMTGGSYLVARRIPMRIEIWDRTSLGEQERIIGRTKGEGAPLGQAKEFDPPDLQQMDVKAHVRLAHPDSNGGVRILRRGYSFVDGSDGLGHLDAGLFFLAYQRDPRTGFIALQNTLAGKSSDLLNEYIVHTGSAVFAVPPGLSGPSDTYARQLLEV